MLSVQRVVKPRWANALQTAKLRYPLNECMTKTPTCALPSTSVVGRRKVAALTLRFAVVQVAKVVQTTVVVVGWSCAPAVETNATVVSKANVNPDNGLTISRLIGILRCETVLLAPKRATSLT